MKSQTGVRRRECASFGCGAANDCACFPTETGRSCTCNAWPISAGANCWASQSEHQPNSIIYSQHCCVRQHLDAQVSNVRLRVITCDTFTADALGNPDSDLLRRRFPGALASARFDAIMATTTVEMRLSLKGLHCAMRTGRRSPRPEPIGSGNEAHQISPRFMINGS